MRFQIMQSFARLRRAACLFSALGSVSFALASCGGGSSLASNPPPTDSTPTDTTPPPPIDTTPPPDTTGGDSIPVSANCSVTDGATAPPPVHVGLPLGPDYVPPAEYHTEYSATIHLATIPSCLLLELNAFRKANIQVYLGIAGNEQYYRDANGFNFAMWKGRVDRFRNLDLAPYFADGTIAAIYLMDEPNDASNWNGHQVSPAMVDSLAQYSKSVWPGIPTMVRTWPYYLAGFHFQYLDVIRFHYLDKFGDLDSWLAKNIADAQALGLNIVGGLNVLNGGSKDSGIPGKGAGRNAMSADEIRTWGAKFLQVPNMCGFMLWEFDEQYFARPDIQAAVAYLDSLAQKYPARPCLRAN